MTDGTSLEQPQILSTPFVHPETEIATLATVPDRHVAVSSLPLTGETVAFTGTLASMTHRDAIRLVEQYGGRATHAVSSATTMLATRNKAAKTIVVLAIRIPQ